MLKNKVLILTLIVLLGAFLRLFWLDLYPVGVTADELQQGYTGYSILKTAKDEWGDFMPLNPRGFGDYKPPLYSYLTIPFEAVLGLNILAVRLPSALAGIATIIVIYFLAKTIFNKSWVGMMAAFILAISSWHIQYSRLAFESNVGVLIFCIGLLAFLKSFKTNGLLILSSFSFGLALFTYHSFKIFTILFVLGLIIIYWKRLKQINRRILFFSLAIWFIAVILIASGIFFSGAGRRAADAAIYNEENLGGLRDMQVQDGLPQPFNRVVNNKVVYVANQFAQNYLGYFSFTFISSPNRADSSLFNLPGEWLIPFWQIVFLLFAIYQLIRNKVEGVRILVLWLLLAPIPAALTKDYMHTQRVEIFLALVPIVASYGAYGLYQLLSTNKYRQLRFLMVLLFFLVVAWSTIAHIDRYLFHTPKLSVGGIKYGYDEAVKFTEQNKYSYDKIVFTKIHSEPQIFIAFYSQMDPNFYQQNSQAWKYFENSGFKFVDMINLNLGQYDFRNIDWEKDKKLKNTLMVASEEEVPDSATVQKTIKSPSGKIIFKIIDTNYVTN